MAPWTSSLQRLACRALALLCLALATATAARAQSLESVLSPGKVIQGHAKWEDDCKACHVKFDRAAQDRLCMDCHKDVGHDVRARAGFHGRMKPQACSQCHTDHKGRGEKIAAFDTKRFDHAQTDYPLPRQAHPGRVRQVPRERQEVARVAERLQRLPPQGRHSQGLARPQVRRLPYREQLEGSPVRPQVRRMKRAGKIADVHFYKYGDHEVWGATAAILRSFLAEISDAGSALADQTSTGEKNPLDIT